MKNTAQIALTQLGERGFGCIWGGCKIVIRASLSHILQSLPRYHFAGPRHFALEPFLKVELTKSSVEDAVR